MRTKLSAIEELRLEKRKLMEECKLYEDDIKSKSAYIKDNFGHLMLNSIVSSTKNGFAGLTSSGSKKKKDKSDNAFGIGSAFATFTPIIWEVLQPFLIGIAVKKAKSIFTRKIKKKNL